MKKRIIQNTDPFIIPEEISSSLTNSYFAHRRITRPLIKQRDTDYDGRLTDSFFKYVKRETDYDRNEVPWAGTRGSKPVIVQISAFLRKVFYSTMWRIKKEST